MTTIKKLASGLLIATGLFTVVSCQQRERREDSQQLAKEANEDKFATRASERDAQFVVDAATGNYAEIKMAQVALDKSANPEIKTLAQNLENAHQGLLSEL